MKKQNAIIWNVPAAPAPWTVEQYHAPGAQARDLWMVRTSCGLVFGPIFGEANARLAAAAPALGDALLELRVFVAQAAERGILNAEEVAPLLAQADRAMAEDLPTER